MGLPVFVIAIVAVVVLIGLIWAMSQSSLSFGQWLLVMLVAALASGATVFLFMSVTGGASPFGGGGFGPDGPGFGPDGPGDPGWPGHDEGTTVTPLPGERAIINGLGVTLANATHPGAYVLAVEPGSAAEGLGMTVGEIITDIDGNRIQNIHDAIYLLDGRKQGEQLSISVSRISPGASMAWGTSFPLESDLSAVLERD